MHAVRFVVFAFIKVLFPETQIKAVSVCKVARASSQGNHWSRIWTRTRRFHWCLLAPPVPRSGNFPVPAPPMSSNLLAKKAKTRQFPLASSTQSGVCCQQDSRKEGRKEGRKGSRSTPSWSLEPEMGCLLALPVPRSGNFPILAQPKCSNLLAQKAKTKQIPGTYSNPISCLLKLSVS